MNEHTPHTPNPTTPTRRTRHTPPRPLDPAVEARIAGYRALSLTPAQRELLLDDVRDAVRRTRPVNALMAHKLLSSLTRFLADTAPSWGGDLELLLTYPNINRWVADAAKAGLGRRTLSVYRGRLNQVRRALDGLEPRMAPALRSLPPVPPLPNTVAQTLELTCVVRGGAPLRAFAAAIAAGVPARELVGTRFESTVAGVRAVTANGVVWPLVDLTGRLDVVVGMEVVDGDWRALQHVAAHLRCFLNTAIATRTFHERVLLSGRPLEELIRRHRLTIDTLNGSCRWLPAVDIATDCAARRWLRG